MRYAGQGYENAVDRRPPLTGEISFGTGSASTTVHAQFHGHAAPDQPVEVVSYRTVATGVLPDVRLARMDRADTVVEDAITGTPRGLLSVGVEGAHRGGRVRAQTVATGPSVRRDPRSSSSTTATTVVCPEQTVRVDEFGNLVITGSRA